MMPPKCNYGNNSQKYLYVEGHSVVYDFQEIFSEICTQLVCKKFKSISNMYTDGTNTCKNDSWSCVLN